MPLGYIRTLSEWILKQALAQWQTHFKELLPGIVPRLSVNVSTVQFQQQNIYAWVSGLLDKCGIKPQHLELEITESILMRDVNKAYSILSDLNDLGVRITLDDFGTGYSSLNYLSRFPLHTVKIDRSFIQNITEDEKQFRLVRTIIRMGQDMELDVVAEGVETESQLALLKELECDLVQGYIFSRPQAAEDLVRWLKNNGRA
ncbi:EAL domain-containing protein [Pseudomonadota bacterium]